MFAESQNVIFAIFWPFLVRGGRAGCARPHLLPFFNFQAGSRLGTSWEIP
jgi:hypothetical protein